MTSITHKIVGVNPHDSASGASDTISPEECSTAGPATRNNSIPAELPLHFLQGDESIPGIVKFTFNGHPVRVILTQEGPRWVAEDVVVASGCTWNGFSSIRPVPADYRRNIPIVVPPGAQNVAVLSESGLLHLLSPSDSPSAFHLLSWIICEVRPSLRWGGQQSAKPSRYHATLAALSQEPITQFAADANTLAMEVKWLNALAIWTDNQLTQMMSSQGLYNRPVMIREDQAIPLVADMIGVELEGLLEVLRQMKVLCSSKRYWKDRYMAYSTFQFESKPYFSLQVVETSTKPDGTAARGLLPVVTPMGVMWLFGLLWAGRFNAILKESSSNPDPTFLNGPFRMLNCL